MNNDSWYRFGIEPINSNGKNYTRTNNEVFNDFQKVESALRLGTNESIANLSKRMKDQKRYTEKLMFFVTAALVSMIVMVAYYYLTASGKEMTLLFPLSALSGSPLGAFCCL